MLDTEKRVVYKAFGLIVISEIPLPELPHLNGNKDMADIVIKIADLSRLWRELNAQQGKFVVKENLIMFHVPDTATFCIQDGNTINVSPMTGADQDKIRLYVLGTCMGALLMQRKVLPLHGSAIAINGKAYAFVGNSGAGKSTLASALLSRGYRLLSDDVIAVSLSGKEHAPLVTPSYPQQKLWKESLDEFGLDTSSFRPLFERETKYAVPVTSNYFTDPLPLAGIFELSKTKNEKVEIYGINGLDRLHTIFQHTFRNLFITRSGLMAWHFNISAKIANHLDMFRLLRPSAGFTAPHLVSLILDTLKKENY